MNNTTPSKADFENALNQIFRYKEIMEEAEYVDINSGKLHRYVGGYPGTNHRMPLCCEVMYQFQKDGDKKIADETEKGQGASITIRYKLPRQ